MGIAHLTDKEVGLHIARQLRAWRVSPNGAAMTLGELSKQSGMGLTPLRRFEKTGGITLRNLVALMRAMGLLDRLQDLVPSPDGPSPLDILESERRAAPRQRAPRRTQAAEKT